MCVYLLDVMCHGAFFDDFLKELFKLLLFAHDIELYGAFGEVFNRANHIETHGDLFHRIAETNSLDSAFECYPFGNHVVSLVVNVVM